jgi:hypothetical protein
MRNLTVRTTVRSLLEELDKIDPEWYNAEVDGEYRKFGGNIYNTEGANMTERTGCGTPIALGRGMTQCGLGYGKPWLHKVALCDTCRLTPELKEVSHDA